MKRSCPWLLATFLALAGCKEPAPPPPGVTPPAVAHEGEGKHEQLPRRVRLEDELATASGITTEPAAHGVLATTVGLPGEVVAVPDRTARVSAPTPGRLERVSFNEGTVVKRGDVLAVLRVPDVGRLRGTLAAARARARASRANADRLAPSQRKGWARSRRWWTPTPTRAPRRWRPRPSPSSSAPSASTPRRPAGTWCPCARR